MNRQWYLLKAGVTDERIKIAIGGTSFGPETGGQEGYVYFRDVLDAPLTARDNRKISLTAKQAEKMVGDGLIEPEPQS
jgi:uncharacterized protein (DUF2225 family)